jgi:hypothetical protein
MKCCEYGLGTIGTTLHFLHKLQLKCYMLVVWKCLLWANHSNSLGSFISYGEDEVL